jgi:hypothetical protein
VRSACPTDLVGVSVEPYDGEAGAEEPLLAGGGERLVEPAGQEPHARLVQQPQLTTHTGDMQRGPSACRIIFLWIVARFRTCWKLCLTLWRELLSLRMSRQALACDRSAGYFSTLGLRKHTHTHTHIRHHRPPQLQSNGHAYEHTSRAAA